MIALLLRCLALCVARDGQLFMLRVMLLWILLAPAMGERGSDSSKLLELYFCRYLLWQVACICRKVDMRKERIDHLCVQTGVDKILALLIDTAMILINTSTEDLSKVIPEELFQRLLPFMREIFNSILGPTSSGHYTFGRQVLKSRKSDIASAIFRLSMDQVLPHTPCDDIGEYIFIDTESGFVKFTLDYWEELPLQISDCFHNLARTIMYRAFDTENTEALISSLFQGSLSCPPIASDELDIFAFLDELKDLGSPNIYGQDIRVVKTPKVPSCSIQNDVKQELHFFDCFPHPKIVDELGVEQCKEAFEDGYTIAIRGAEFRHMDIAAVADSLAILFGQPSVGANIYLTPFMSQGLARHFDDHCVFVLQLSGQKQWIISPSSSNLLPRLYEPPSTFPILEVDSRSDKEYILAKGDILYVPRGCFHEANTMIDEMRKNPHDAMDISRMRQDELDNVSLHITFGVEIEPPFEWEGFTHIALHCWNEKQNRAASSHCNDRRSRNRTSMYVLLLHYAVWVVANRNHIFRKACMVAARPLPEALSLVNKSSFSYMVKCIDEDTNFIEILESIKVVIQDKKEDSLQWMGWLRHLPQKGEAREKIDFVNPLEKLEELVAFCSDHIAKAKEDFSSLKSEFCRDAAYDDACECFQVLLEKYRKVRKQYMNGMLSLHTPLKRSF